MILNASNNYDICEVQEAKKATKSRVTMYKKYDQIKTLIDDLWYTISKNNVMCGPDASMRITDALL